jgi:hypothetical protein
LLFLPWFLYMDFFTVAASQVWCISPPQQNFQTQQSLFSKQNLTLVPPCKVRYIKHVLNIVGEDKRFVFVTKDPEITTKKAYLSLLTTLFHWWPIYTETRLWRTDTANQREGGVNESR